MLSEALARACEALQWAAFHAAHADAAEREQAAVRVLELRAQLRRLLDTLREPRHGSKRERERDPKST
jgi:hypothetical protein